jgi:hypothetical protein
MSSQLPYEPLLERGIYTLNHIHLFEDETWMKQFKNRSGQTLFCQNMEEYFTFKNNMKLSLNSFSSKFMQYIGLSNIKIYTELNFLST